MKFCAREPMRCDYDRENLDLIYPRAHGVLRKRLRFCRRHPGGIGGNWGSDAISNLQFSILLRMFDMRSTQ